MMKGHLKKVHISFPHVTITIFEIVTFLDPIKTYFSSFEDVNQETTAFIDFRAFGRQLIYQINLSITRVFIE